MTTGRSTPGGGARRARRARGAAAHPGSVEDSPATAGIEAAWLARGLGDTAVRIGLRRGGFARHASDVLIGAHAAAPPRSLATNDAADSIPRARAHAGAGDLRPAEVGSA